MEFAKTSFPRGMSLEEMRVAVDVGKRRRLQIHALYFARARRRADGRA